jgi:hypothetical protein
MESDQPRHDCPAACVVAQQYSSATFISLRCHSRKKKFGGRVEGGDKTNIMNLRNLICLQQLFNYGAK